MFGVERTHGFTIPLRVFVRGAILHWGELTRFIMDQVAEVACACLIAILHESFSMKP